MSPPLPLTDLAFNLLVALADEELHGYALVKRLRRLEGRASLRTGTVYAALARLEEAGWVEEAEQPTEARDERRRYYRVTPGGRRTARAEATRLAASLERARATSLMEPDHG